MPANLPPEYFEVEKKYHQATTIEEKIKVLRELLSVVPKHKGTEKLQAQIKTKIAKLRRELQEERKTGKRGPSLIPRKQGAGRIVIIGPPNTGKSSILASLTTAKPAIADYPFTTTQPVVGMMPYEDIMFQMIDTSPIIEGHADWWVIEIVRSSDLVLVVLDAFDKNMAEYFEFLKSFLSHEKDINLVNIGQSSEAIFGPLVKRTLVVLNKSDLGVSFELKDRLSQEFATIEVSASLSQGIDELKELIFKAIEVIRVYTKPPGKPPVMENPLILRKGQTILDAAYKLHKDFAKKLRYARVWGKSVRFPGQRVDRNHQLCDRDIVEFHV